MFTFSDCNKLLFEERNRFQPTNGICKEKSFKAQGPQIQTKSNFRCVILQGVICILLSVLTVGSNLIYDEISEETCDHV